MQIQNPQQMERSMRAVEDLGLKIRAETKEHESKVGRCPTFLLHLPSGPAKNRHEDLLLRRAVEASSSSLCWGMKKIIRKIKKIVSLVLKGKTRIKTEKGQNKMRRLKIQKG